MAHNSIQIRVTIDTWHEFIGPNSLLFIYIEFMCTSCIGECKACANMTIANHEIDVFAIFMNITFTYE